MVRGARFVIQELRSIALRPIAISWVKNPGHTLVTHTLTNERVEEYSNLTIN